MIEWKWEEVYYEIKDNQKSFQASEETSKTK